MDGVADLLSLLVPKHGLFESKGIWSIYDGGDLLWSGPSEALIAMVRGVVTRKASARRTDPVTSWDAARSLSPSVLRRSQREVLSVLGQYGPMTDMTLVETYQYLAAGPDDLRSQSPSGIRTRRRELVDLGHVRDTGRRLPTRSGRQAVLWGVVRFPTKG